MSSNLKVNTILPSTGTNVAIGTAGGSVNIVGNIDIDINSGISTFNDIHISDKIVHEGDANTAIRFPAADTITAETGGSERLRIDSSGRLLVGHTSPTSVGVGAAYNMPLQVIGTSYDTAGIVAARYAANSFGPTLHFVKSRNATKGSQTIVQNDDTLGFIRWYGSDGTDTTNAAAMISAEVDATPASDKIPGRLSFWTTDDLTYPRERLRITSAGKVGIATNNPQRDLHIHNSDSSTNSYLQITSATTGTTSTDGFQLWAYGNGGNKNAAIVQREDADIELWANNTERLRIDSSGRLIQRYSAAPYDNRAATFQSPAGQAQTYIAVVNTESNGTSGILFGDHAGQNAGNYDGYINYSHQYQHMAFMVNAGNERVRIDSSGRVLIGTTTEGHTSGDDLTIATPDTTGITLRGGSSGGGRIFFSDGTSGTAEYEGVVGYDHGTNHLYFSTNHAEKMRITSNGRLLLNTTDNSGYSNRSAYFTNPNDNWNYISITGASAGGAGIVFGDSTAQNRGNYESYMYHNNADNNFSIITNAGSKEFRFEQGGDLNIIDGNLKVASGHGIDFSATAGTGTSELLDDYEEGSFTLAATSNATMTSSSGTYTKIGRVVHVKFSFQINQINSGSTTHVTGLPFSAAASGFGSTGYFASIGNFNSISPYATGTTVYFNVINTNNSFAQNPSILGNSSRVDGSITYTTN